VAGADAVAVIDAALDAGLNHLDTAHAYGRSGESERRQTPRANPRNGAGHVHGAVFLELDG